MTVGLVGNRRLRVAPQSMIDFMAKLPLEAIILLRAGNISRPGWFERLVAKACDDLWMSHEWMRPDPNGDEGATFDRDVAFAGRCDVILAFFDGMVADHTSGTWHIVEKALDQHVPVYAYGFDGEAFHRIGEWDEHDSWGGTVPKG